MRIKFAILFILAVAATAAVFEGVPLKAWNWFQDIVSSAGNENLSGLLRGPLEGFTNSNLTSEGIITWTNNQRSEQGHVPLHNNLALQKAAQAKLDDMFEQQYFEHESPDGKMPSDVIKSAGYAYLIVGENLALGNFQNDEILVQAWMDSPGHRANILNSKFQEIGVATRKGTFEGKEVWLAVQEFGSPLSSCPSPGERIKDSLNADKATLANLQSQIQAKKDQIDANKFKSEAEYNQAITEYNALVRRSNSLGESTSAQVEKYNQSVNDFNSCLESNT